MNRIASLNDLILSIRANAYERHKRELVGLADTEIFDPTDRPRRELKPAMALDCVIVLGTCTQDGTHEFRVGKFTHENQIKAGLCEYSEPLRRTSPLVLRRDVALHCFGSSKVYDVRERAVEDVGKLFPDNGGIKVIRLCCEFPAGS